MPGFLLQCSAEKNGERCQRRCRLVIPKGVEYGDETYTCEGCKSGKDPYVPRSSVRKGQQKQKKK